MTSPFRQLLASILTINPIVSRIIKTRRSFIVVFIVSTSIFLGTLLVVQDKINTTEYTREHDRLSYAINLTIRSIVDKASSNINWDDAVEHISVNFDKDWADANIGSYFIAVQGFDFVQLINANNEAIYHSVTASGLSDPDLAIIRRQMTSALSEVRRQEKERPSLRAGPLYKTFITTPIYQTRTVQVHGDHYIVTAMLVQPDFGRAAAPQRSAIAILGSRLEGKVIDDIANILALRSPHLRVLTTDVDAASSSREAGLKLPGSVTDHTVTRVLWEPSRPGDSLALLLATPLLFLALLPLYLLQLGRAYAISDQAKTDFLARMGHEIRTPLGGIISLITLLEHSRPSKEQLNVLRTMESSAQSLMRILNHIVDTVRIGAQRLRLVQSPVAPALLLEGVAELFLASAHAQGLTLSCFVSASIRGKYLLDNDRLRECLCNIVSNAINYTPAGKVILRLELVKGADGPNLVFTISDTGVGIGADDLRRLGKPFIQATAAGDTANSGAGLGLSITRELIELMGGEMSISSRPQAGTDVTLKIPAIFLGPRQRNEAIYSLLKGVEILCLSSDEMEIQFIKENCESIGATFVSRNLPTLELDDINHNTLIIGPKEIYDDLVPIIDRYGKLSARLVPAVLLAQQDFAVDVSPRPGILVTTALARARILDAIARALGRAPVAEPQQSVPDLQMPATACSREEAIAAGCLILVVDDHPVNRLVFEKQMALIGRYTDSVAGGDQALEAIDANDYAIVFTDCAMPGIDGYTLARRIRKLPGPKAALPIIAITANKSPDEQQTCLQAGMNDCVVKPVPIETLRQVLLKWLPRTAAPGGLPADHVFEIPRLPPPIPENEAERLDALNDSCILDTPPESEFDAITALASSVCRTPIALFSLVDTDRQWFKSRVGLEVTETPRRISFCGYTVHIEKTLQVEDALTDPRFADNPLVNQDPKIRAYMGAPVRSPGGYVLGTLCVIDRRPRTFSVAQRDVLESLADVTAKLLAVRTKAPGDPARGDINARSQDFGPTREGMVANDEQFFDIAVARTFFGADGPGLDVALRAFREGIEADLAALKSAIAVGGIEDLWNIVHRLKAPARYMGADRLAIACEELGQLPKTTNWPEIVSLTTHLTTIGEAVVQALIAESWKLKTGNDQELSAPVADAAATKVPSQ